MSALDYLLPVLVGGFIGLVLVVAFFAWCCRTAREDIERGRMLW